MFQVFSYLFLIFLIHNITGNKNVHVALRFPESIIHRCFEVGDARFFLMVVLNMISMRFVKLSITKNYRI